MLPKELKGEEGGCWTLDVGSAALSFGVSLW